jgi:hypothetical protein
MRQETGDKRQETGAPHGVNACRFEKNLTLADRRGQEFRSRESRGLILQLLPPES